MHIAHRFGFEEQKEVGRYFNRITMFLRVMELIG